MLAIEPESEPLQMQQTAAIPLRKGLARHEHLIDVGTGHVAVHGSSGCREIDSLDAARRDRYHDLINPDARFGLGLANGFLDRLFGLGQIGNCSGADAARAREPHSKFTNGQSGTKPRLARFGR